MQQEHLIPTEEDELVAAMVADSIGLESEAGEAFIWWRDNRSPDKSLLDLLCEEGFLTKQATADIGLVTKGILKPEKVKLMIPYQKWDELCSYVQRLDAARTAATYLGVQAVSPFLEEHGLAAPTEAETPVDYAPRAAEVWDQFTEGEFIDLSEGDEDQQSGVGQSAAAMIREWAGG